MTRLDTVIQIYARPLLKSDRSAGRVKVRWSHLIVGCGTIAVFFARRLVPLPLSGRKGVQSLSSCYQNDPCGGGVLLHGVGCGGGAEEGQAPALPPQSLSFARRLARVGSAPHAPAPQATHGLPQAGPAKGTRQGERGGKLRVGAGKQRGMCQRGCRCTPWSAMYYSVRGNGAGGSRVGRGRGGRYGPAAPAAPRPSRSRCRRP